MIRENSNSLSHIPRCSFFIHFWNIFFRNLFFAVSKNPSFLYSISTKNFIQCENTKKTHKESANSAKKQQLLCTHYSSIIKNLSKKHHASIQKRKTTTIAHARHFSIIRNSSKKIQIQIETRILNHAILLLRIPGEFSLLSILSLSLSPFLSIDRSICLSDYLSLSPFYSSSFHSASLLSTPLCVLPFRYAIAPRHSTPLRSTPLCSTPLHSLSLFFLHRVTLLFWLFF